MTIQWPAPTGKPATTEHPLAESITSGQLVELLAGTDAKAAKRCYRALDYWRTAGAIRPSGRFRGGSGDWAYWSPLDVARLIRIWELRSRMNGYGMKIPTPVVADIWNTLGQGNTWTLSVDLVIPDGAKALTP